MGSPQRNGKCKLKFLKISALLFLLLITFGIETYHVGVFPLPTLSPDQISRDPLSSAQFISRDTAKIHQLILHGTPYNRGLAAGMLTRNLLAKQEQELTDALKRFFPSLFVFKLLEIPAIRWFKGVENYFEPWMIEEMYGVSKSTSPRFDSLGDSLTRQVAYHGLHEVGQMMVDQKGDDLGCTVIALPTKNGWFIGRNFDFEGGRVFDAEKILKWVFPFVSVIWAGMVGVVTGVNAEGVYLSLNAAGSTDFARIGTPSTLIALKALQFSKTAAEAVSIIQKEQMFITDIFVVSDRTTHQLFRVEKSPKATEIIELKNPSVVTNHLISARFKDDSINTFRREKLTSHFRADRGQVLVNELEPKISGLRNSELELAVLSILRDKGQDQGKKLHLGNRRAIDSLIATHSVVYNEPDNYLFVSRGPSLVGEFVGYDLTKSFQAKNPVTIYSLPQDPSLDAQKYAEIKQAGLDEVRAEKLIHHQKCHEAELVLNESKFRESYTYYTTLGDLFECKGNHDSAKQSWLDALSLSPAYVRETRDLKTKLGLPL
jgi:isopenicillin-N N-acyltransferase-like protein